MAAPEYTMIGTFEIDATISEEHTDEIEITDNPVEDGTPVNDHARRKSQVLNLDIVVSETPIGAIAARRSVGTSPVEDFRAYLNKLAEDLEPIVVTTRTRTYENMVLQSNIETISAQSGDAYRGRLVFKKIRFITNERTFVPVAVPSARKKNNRGNKASVATAPDGTSPAPNATATEGKSALYSIFHDGEAPKQLFGHKL